LCGCPRYGFSVPRLPLSQFSLAGLLIAGSDDDVPRWLADSTDPYGLWGLGPPQSITFNRTVGA